MVYCPYCGHEMYEDLGDGTYLCLVCGNIFF